MTSLLTPRNIFLLIVFVCVGSMAAAFYFEYVMGLEPCPLCMTQRFFMVLTGVIAIVALIHRPKTVGVTIYSLVCALMAFAGSFFSGRQVWLQSLPPEEVPACGPPLEYIMENFPLLDALQVLLAGDGNCSEVLWQFFGMSMPMWVLIVFVGLGVLSLSNVVWVRRG